jgi:hypothetical protein
LLAQEKVTKEKGTPIDLPFIPFGYSGSLTPLRKPATRAFMPCGYNSPARKNGVSSLGSDPNFFWLGIDQEARSFPIFIVGFGCVGGGFKTPAMLGAMYMDVQAP